jgi:AcrR family transcriptional regulator
LYLAALEVFRRDGVHNCRIDDIAQKAEVSRAAFYFHFPTKEHVLLDFLAEREAPTVKALSELPSDANLDTVLHCVTDSMREVWQNESALLIDVMSVSLRHTALISDREAGAVRRMMAHRFQELAKRHEIATSLPPEIMSDFFLFNCMVALVSWASNPASSLEAALKASMHLYLEGARPASVVAR